MAYLADYHMHSRFSFDGPKDGTGTMDALCEAAIRNGLSEIAVTDHMDINVYVKAGGAHLDCDAVFEEMESVKEKYLGRLRILSGIELGQAAEYPAEARAILERHPYDYVIGSLHFLPGKPDFCDFDYSKYTDDELRAFFASVLLETTRMCMIPGIHTIAHFIYMYRYLRRAGRSFDFREFYPQIREMYRVMIERGIALEINTSTLRDSRIGVTMPTRELLALYRECGGELIVCGSDSHGSSFVGAGICEAHTMLKELGFRYLTVIREGKPAFYLL